ncbi:MAG TPA: hypothetical protein VGC47_09035 [Acidimicrobiia bacterium]|jgi:hypothetical protein
MAAVLALVAAACGDAGGAGDIEDAGSTTTSAPADGGSDQGDGGAGDDQGDRDGGNDGGGTDDVGGGDGGDDPGIGFPAGGSGTFVVDGDTFEGVPVGRCEPFSFGGPPHEDDLSLFALVGSMEGLNVDLSNDEGFAASGDGMINYEKQTVTVDYSRSGEGDVEQFSALAANDQDGAWYLGGAPNPGETKTPMDSVPFAREGDRISGTLILEQDWPEGATGTVEVSYDLEVPSEIIDC